MSSIRVRQAGSVAVITLDEPGKRNILSAGLCLELSAAVKAAEQDPGTKSLVITGAPPAFCAGADLDDLRAAAQGNTDTLHAVYQSFLDVAGSSLPTIAAINGAAVGAGLNLALACDIRLAGEDALFDTRFLKIGLHPGGGHSWMLLRAVGWAQAARMLLLGRPLRAQEACSAGLVQQIVATDGLLDAAIELARSADPLPRSLIVEAKATMRLAAGAGHAETFARETDRQMHSLHQPAFQELLTKLQASLGSR